MTIPCSAWEEIFSAFYCLLDIVAVKDHTCLR